MRLTNEQIARLRNVCEGEMKSQWLICKHKLQKEFGNKFADDFFPVVVTELCDRLLLAENKVNSLEQKPIDHVCA